MAIYHLSVKTVSRSTGRSAVAAAAYRAGERLTNQADGATHDYGRRRGVTGRVLLVPDGAGGLVTLSGAGWRAARERLWNAAEAAERRVNSTVAREYELALPAELDAAGREALAVGFAREIVSRFGVVADVAVHAPSREGNERNHHAHILTTTRAVGTGGALGAKTRVLDDKKTGPAQVEALRELWAIQVNHALQRIEAEARVDHRSHARRGLDALPSITMGAGATALERRAQRAHDGREGGPDALAPVTRRGRRQAEIAAANAAAAERERGRHEAEARAALSAMVRKARGAFLEEREAEEDERERLAAAARMEAEHRAQRVRRAEAERIARDREERQRRAEIAAAELARAEAEAERGQAEIVRVAMQPPERTVEQLLPVSRPPDTPRPIQAPQRPSEAMREGDPDLERWRAMPMAALRREVENLQPLSAEAKADFLPGVQAERAAEGKALMTALKAGRRAKRAEDAARQAEREIEAIRTEPGLLARLGVWLHDQGLRPSAALAQREAALAEERRRQAKALDEQARHQAEAKAAKAREQAAKVAGLPGIEAELRPARARHKAVLAVWLKRDAAQHAEHLARLCEEANANQHRAWAREAEEQARLQAERERRAEAARNAAKAGVPEQDRNPEYDDGWESSADDEIGGHEP